MAVKSNAAAGFSIVPVARTLMRNNVLRWAITVVVLGSSTSLVSQTANESRGSKLQVLQISQILGLEQRVQQLRELQEPRPCGSPPSVAEIALRQEISEAALAASFEVDGVVAEIDNERALLMEERTVLGSKRDRAVNLLNVANLITGTGIGIAVNALQFSSSTANVGNSLGVGSGAGATVLSILGIRRQRGSSMAVGKVPNMLAPLFDRPAVLNAAYPGSVRAYLDSTPPENESGGSTRLQQLKKEWIEDGHLPPGANTTYEDHIVRLTTSEDPQVKVTIDDLSDRIAMLSDVSGRVSLMKRDLALFMRSMGSTAPCNEAHP
jgi:hypothetical protein